MTNKFEDMPRDVRESILRTIEHRLSHGCSSDDKSNVDSILAAYGGLFHPSTRTSTINVTGNITITVPDACKVKVCP
jgi:hypothetical protein